MRHLTPDEFVDLLESGAEGERRGHPSACAACREKLGELRRAFALASDDVVPEPSPLFWEHLSERVRQATSHEPGPVSHWTAWTWRAVFPLALAATLALVVGSLVANRTPQEFPAPASHRAVPDPASDLVAADDESFALLTELSSDVDLESAAATGMLISPETAEHTIFQLSAGEREELRRLLNEELGGPES